MKLSGWMSATGMGALLLLAATVSAQTETRRVAPFYGGGTQFRGSLGSSSLSTFRAFSTATPTRSTDAHVAPRLPTAGTGLYPRGLSAVSESYRVTGSAGALDVGGVRRHTAATDPYRSPLGDLPVGAFGTPAPPAIPGALLPGASSGGPAGVARPTAASGASPWRQGPWGAAPVERMPVADRFDLDGQLKVNDYFSRGVEQMKAGRFDAALGDIRLGLVFSPGRAEGEWLMAVAHVGADDAAQAVFRLRNAVAGYPPLLAQRRGVAGLLGQELVERRLAAADPSPAESDGDAAPTTQPDPAPAALTDAQVLAAAWLASDSGQAERAGRLLARIGPLDPAAQTVADGLRQAIGADLGTWDSGAGVQRPAIPVRASQSSGFGLSAMSLGDWLVRAGPLMGMPGPGAGETAEK